MLSDVLDWDFWRLLLECCCLCDELLEEAELEVPCPLRNNDFSFIILFLFLYFLGLVLLVLQNVNH